MPKNYSESYYLTGVDIVDLIKGYHQAYIEKFPKDELAQLDERFWQNDKGELIFYAGEQMLVDLNSEGITQQVGRGFYDATLAMTARFLELDTPMLPADTIHVISLINFDNGHWTSAVLSIKNINEDKYQEIYALYQDFKQFLKTNHPDFEMVRGEQSCTNLFVQYATGNRHGSVVGIQNKSDTENYIREFFTTIGKADLLEIKGLLEQDRYVEGDLKLVLEPRDDAGSLGVYHFDSMLSPTSNKRLEQACTRFLNANNTTLLSARNIPRQTGATCGEHAILNAFRYLFFGLTNAICSSDLRSGTNHFCPAIAKLFLFDYDSKTFKEEYARIMAEQKLKEQKAIQEKPTSKAESKNETVNKINASDYLEYGIYVGIGFTLVCSQVIAPMFLGIANPLYAGMFSVAAGYVVAQVAKVFAPEVEEAIIEIKNGTIFSPTNDISEEQKILEKQSEKTFEKEYQNKNTQQKPVEVLDNPQTFTPMLAAANKAAGETPVTVIPGAEPSLQLVNTTVVNATEVKKAVI